MYIECVCVCVCVCVYVCVCVQQELVMVSARLDSVEHKLEERCQELSQLPPEQRQAVKEEVRQLTQKRDKLHQERQAIDNKLHDGEILSLQEERR